MYKWFSVRVKSRLGIAFSDADREYLQLERVKTFSGIANVSRDADLGTFVTANGRKLFFRLDPHSDAYVLEQVFVNGEYEPVAAAYSENFGDKADPTIVDAGANVGFTTAYFLQTMPQARVVCIEPDDENLCILRKNLETEIATGSVTVLKKALMNRSGLSITTENDFRDGKDWSITVRKADGETSLKSVSIPQLMQEMGWTSLDILKIDIEGSERFLFQDGESLDWLPQVKLLALEIHDEFAIRDQIYGKLDRHGFRYTDVGETTIAINTELSPAS